MTSKRSSRRKMRACILASILPVRPFSQSSARPLLLKLLITRQCQPVAYACQLLVYKREAILSCSIFRQNHSRRFVAADLDRAQNPGRPHPRTPIIRRLHADRGDNPDPRTSAGSKRSLTTSARLDNEPNLFGKSGRRQFAAGIVQSRS